MIHEETVAGKQKYSKDMEIGKWDIMIEMKGMGARCRALGLH